MLLLSERGFFYQKKQIRIPRALNPGNVLLTSRNSPKIFLSVCDSTLYAPKNIEEGERRIRDNQGAPSQN